MIQKISKRLTTFFVNKKNIAEVDREIYDYSFEIFISTLLNLIILIVIGIATARYIETFIFISVFMTMRGLGGGCHAKTHMRCILGLLVFYSTFIGLTYAPLYILSYMSIPFYSLSVILGLILAPVGCANKDIEKAEGRKLKIKLVFAILILSIAYVIMMVFEVTRIYAFSIAFTMFSVSILYIIGTIQNKMRQKKVI